VWAFASTDRNRSVSPVSPSGAERLRRLIFPSYGALSNAAQATDELARAGEQLVLHGADVALLSSHSAGLSHRRAAGRLGTALWEVFPGQVALLDRNGVVVAVNRAWREFGLAHGSVATAGLGMNYLEVCDRAAAHGEPGASEAAEAATSVRSALAGRKASERVPYPVQSAEGQSWFSLQAVAIPGQHGGALVVHTDITEDRVREQSTQHRGFHDPLTGLPNRALLADRLEHAVLGAARDPRSLAVLFIEIDACTSDHGRFGPDTRDDLLRRVTERMSGSVRSADTFGRWGGDEFLVIAERLDVSDSADVLASRLVASVSAPFAIGSDRNMVSVSIGVAHLESGQQAAQLVQAAEDALQTGRADRDRQVGIAP
jgi:diguanylate cyclase (GGDEF)-like protein